MQRDLVKMSKVQMMRSFVNQRLTAAAEEIFDLFERTIVEYEEQLHRSKEKQSNLLDDHRHHVRLQVSDIQLLMVRKEEVHPEQQERGSSLNQEDSPEPPQIKEDQEELWSSQEGEQLQGPEEADIIQITFYPVPVKTEEDDGEKPQSPQLQPTLTDQIRDEYSKTEAKGEDCEGSDPTTDFNIDSHLQPVSDEETSHSSETVTDDCNCDWEASEPQEGLNPLQNEDAPVSDVNCDTGSASESSTTFGQKKQLRKHKIIHTGDKLFSCSVCGKSFRDNGDLKRHSFVHTGEKPLSCSVCGKRFTQNGDLKRHSVVHTGEKPFSCKLCDKRFTQRGTLKLHYVAHSGEKPFSCEVCGHRFTNSGDLKRHSIIHTGEKPFSCSVCDRRFTYKQNFRTHKCVAKSRKK
ncbi:zinc finger protein 32-like isoform X7 [Labrus mixtus]|uniref:zinc finger protein 32-like isoform X7 n=1 Tax=Labrus mixtus TaxID=508554 RepID=UPI0029C0DEB6|nr:zinc finger protein 32-like isoform X7 [Labrus mixtus]